MATPTSPYSVPGATPAQNDMYTQLKQRAQFNYGLDRNDPIIKGQVDAYRAEQQRGAQRNQQQAAEAMGPYATGALRNEQRMTNEQSGQNTANFQSQLMGRELDSRRGQDLQLEQLGLSVQDRQRYWDAVNQGLI
jgi:rhamnose utilization protein RhaD (predicted bifunctional aldolase and dehydrogenase)